MNSHEHVTKDKKDEELWKDKDGRNVNALRKLKTMGCYIGLGGLDIQTRKR